MQSHAGTMPNADLTMEPSSTELVKLNPADAFLVGPGAGGLGGALN